MFLYFIKAGDAIKIGLGDDIEKRMITLQVGNPNRLDLLHSIDLPDQEAKEKEIELHQLLHKTNLNGEWFQATQYLIDFIENIKKNGLASYKLWVLENYQNTYKEHLDSLKIKIEQDIISGNLISLEKLKSDLGDILNAVFVIPSLPTHMTEAIRNWIKNRDTPFMLRDVYNHYGISTRSGKKHITMILSRLTEKGMIEKQRTSDPWNPLYKKIDI